MGQRDSVGRIHGNLSRRIHRVRGEHCAELRIAVHGLHHTGGHHGLHERLHHGLHHRLHHGLHVRVEYGVPRLLLLLLMLLLLTVEVGVVAQLPILIVVGVAGGCARIVAIRIRPRMVR